jgi:hypothetical protein
MEGLTFDDIALEIAQGGKASSLASADYEMQLKILRESWDALNGWVRLVSILDKWMSMKRR